MSKPIAPEKTMPLDNTVTTILGKGAHFEGKLHFEGLARIDGQLTGEIFTNDKLLIGENAIIDGELEVNEIEIRGRVKGKIRARSSVVLKQPAVVDGEIDTPTLSVEPGAILDGACRMSQNKRSDKEFTLVTAPVTNIADKIKA